MLSHLGEYNHLGCYIHIPFCLKKCDYCDFFSVEHFSSSLLDEYTDKIVREIEFALARRAQGFDTVYIGGGNPAVLGAKRLKRIISSARGANCIEITVEINPEQVNMAFLDELIPWVTRVSVGIQSLHDEHLRMLGRRADRKNVIESLKVLAAYRQEVEMSLDFMDAIPGQKPYDTRDDILRAFDILGFNHLSVYDLIIEEQTPLAGRFGMQADRNGNLDIDEYDLSGDLRQLGFERYEISNWARDAKTCVHNQHYWDMDPYLGIGPAAVSLLYDRHEAVHLYGAKDIARYIYEKQPYSDRMYEVEKLSRTEFLEEQLIMGVRTSSGISIGRLESMFSTELGSIMGAAAENWITKGFVRITGDRLILTETGMKFANSVLVDLILALEGRTGEEPLALDTYF
jgi:oxygen-independent coproporphyrinogen-3 oxidase